MRSTTSTTRAPRSSWPTRSRAIACPIEGHPQNHSALLTRATVRARGAAGCRGGQPWERLAPARRRRDCAADRRPAARPARPRQAPPRFRTDLGRTPTGVGTTQAALGRALLDLTRAAPEVGAPNRHGEPGRQLQHEPCRLGQQGRRVVHHRTARLVRRRRRDHPALAGDADRAAHRTRHRRDQPRRPDRRARRDLEPLGPAAAPDRGAVRPVRRARAGAVVVRHLRGRSVDPGRHAVRGHPRRRRWRPPIDHDAVHRHRTAGLRDLRAGVRGRHRMVPAGQPGPAGPAGRQRRPTCGCPPGRSTRSWPRYRPTRRPGSAGAVRWWPARTRCAGPLQGPPRARP